MKKLITLSLFLALAVQFSSCDLFDDDNKKEELPPVTQEGKNTFGCLVNGKVWLPKGYNGTTNLDLSYDPAFKGGAFDVGAYRITNEIDQFLSFGGNNVNKIGRYDFIQSTDSPGAYFSDKKFNCRYDEQLNNVKGFFIITKLDLNAEIISGTFEFTLAKTDCDTIRVTEGRFDMKIQ